MKTFKARGIVLREYEAGESDKRLVLLCKEYGRITIYARGARKPKSKFMAAAQLFTYGDFVISDGRQFFSMSQAEVIESFYAVRNDYDRLTHAHFLLEVCEKTVLENIPCDDLLLLLLRALSLLCKTSADNAAQTKKIAPLQVARVFLFRFFLFYGIAPETDVCCICGGEPVGLFFCDEGVICQKCRTHAGTNKMVMPLSLPTLSAIRHILNADVKSAFLFNASPAVLHELTTASRLFWDSHFQIRLQSEALLAEI